MTDKGGATRTTCIPAGRVCRIRCTWRVDNEARGNAKSRRLQAKVILRCVALCSGGLPMWRCPGVRLPATRRVPPIRGATKVQRLSAWLPSLILITILCICTTEMLPSSFPSSVFHLPIADVSTPRPPLELALHVLEDLGDVVLGELRGSAATCNVSSGVRAVSSSQASWTTTRTPTQIQQQRHLHPSELHNTCQHDPTGGRYDVMPPQSPRVHRPLTRPANDETFLVVPVGGLGDDVEMDMVDDLRARVRRRVKAVRDGSSRVD
jgi:hypothetical protein